MSLETEVGPKACMFLFFASTLANRFGLGLKSFLDLTEIEKIKEEPMDPFDPPLCVFRTKEKEKKRKKIN